MYKTIGCFAHVDAGKTTFSEQLLFHTKSIKHRGRVDHRDAFLDSHDIEKQRGITVFADQGHFDYNDSTYFLIDTPGHIDFSPEMERAIQVMDVAIVIISAVEGVEGHTETVWQLLRKHQVPTFFFINKIDRTGADVERVLGDIRANLTVDVCDITASYDEGKMDEGLIEFIAERNESLFDVYIEKGYQPELWLTALKNMIQNGLFFPCSSGSALQDIGIAPFLKKLDELTETNYSNEGPFAGRVYKMRHDENGNRLTFIKALSGTLNVRDQLSYEDVTEKITQIRVYNGGQYKTVDRVQAGELFAVTGLSAASIGTGLGELKEKAVFEMRPTLKSKVNLDPAMNVKEAFRYFKILDVEDPSLHVVWEESRQEIHIQVMGPIQLEVLEELVKERFGFAVSFEDPEIIYKETIENVVIGYGHFEPLKHYAEVHLKLQPAERNSGISFFNECHADDLSVGNQNLIRASLFERKHHGLLTGSELTDVRVTLLTGKAHIKHTSGGDFREATLRALRQGLEKAENILLEPFYSFKIKVDTDHMGRVISDIQTAHGQVDPPKIEADKVTLTGKAPVSTFMGYGKELAAITKGKGVLNMVVSGYERCHNEKEVIERINYNKDADPEYSSSSIFCSKGQGYAVPWDQAEKAMHII